LVAIDLDELQQTNARQVAMRSGGDRCGGHTKDEDRTARSRLAAERQRYEHEHERADMLARGQEPRLSS